MSHSTAGSSAKYAKPKNSVISETPGPLVAVKARAPFQPAPITMPMAASSSSACSMAKLRVPSLPTRNWLQYLSNASAKEVDGVMGYHAHTVAPP